MFEALLLLPLFIRLCKTFEAHPRLSLFKLGAFHHIELSILGRLQPDVSRCICGRGCRWGAPGHMWISFGPTSSQTRPSNSVQILRSCQVSRHSMLFMSALEYKCCLETTSSGFSDLKNVPNPSSTLPGSNSFHLERAAFLVSTGNGLLHGALDWLFSGRL